MMKALWELILRNKTRIGATTLVMYLTALTDAQVIEFLKSHLWLGTIVNIINGALIASGSRVPSDHFYREKKLIEDTAKKLDLPK